MNSPVKLLALFLVCSFGSSVRAQDSTSSKPGHAIYAVSGLNRSNFLEDNFKRHHSGISNTLLSIGYRLEFSKRLRLRLQIQYESKGGKYQEEMRRWPPWHDNILRRESTILHYFNAPILAELGLGGKASWYALIGGYAGYMISGTFYVHEERDGDYEDYEETDVKSESPVTTRLPHRFDFGISFGLGRRIFDSKHFLMGVEFLGNYGLRESYHYGITRQTNLSDYNYDDPYGPQPLPVYETEYHQFRNASLQFLFVIGYRFNKW